MFKKILSAFLIASVVNGNLWAGATFSRIKTWSSGETLTASDLNAEYNNILTNLTPAGMDDYSANTTEMRTVTDPYPASAESLATSLQGELERLRYQILEIKKAIQTSNVTYWYQDLPTAGIFTIVTSSVGINDTTPSYALDVTGTGHITGAVTLDSTLAVTGNITSDGNITTTGDDVDISTHAAVTGNLSVGGNLSVTGTFSPSITHVRAHLSGNVSLPTSAAVLINTWTDDHDTLSEMGTTTFTATSAGYYLVCASMLVSATDEFGTVYTALRINGTNTAYLSRVITDASVAANMDDILIPGCQTVSLSANDNLTITVAGQDQDGDDGTVMSGATLASFLTIDRLL